MTKRTFIIANWGSDSMLILLQYNHQPFLNQVTHFTGNDSRPYSVAVGDFNDDHRLDVVVANYGSDNVGILLGYGNRSFQNQMIYSTGFKFGPCSVAVGDINSDNRLDIVVANSLTNKISILLEYGNGIFLLKNSYSTGDDSHPNMVSVWDVNKDDQLDIIVVNSIKMYSYLMGYDSHPYSVALGDFNNDSWIDMAVTNYGTDNVEILLQAC
ncbi:unnamed protein product [Rotaria sordida]|uniref:VCBS repeat-containing protein n=1 Tax=Rotaria sordida TaxID=392033 RepID=A0A815N4P3_9BILA|nr:unnamed protein product [Rotaria sordida]CAF1631893.1 unnamed protein product [Rotaria sordida]